MYRCKECSSQLAGDQKYCVACGARRGDLPSRIARLIESLDVPAPPAVAGVPPVVTAPAAVGFSVGGLAAALDGWLENAEYPTPRVAALAVMSVLAFGVILGSVVGATASKSPLYVMAPAAPAAAATAAAPAPAAAPVAEATGEQPAEQPATDEAAPTTATGPSAVKHVWLIVLSGQGYDKSFGDTQGQSYLTTDLVGQGELIPDHYAVAQGGLANQIALVSGQGPTWQILQGCPTYSPVTPGTIDATTGQAQGDGCVFPDSVKTIFDGVTATGKSAFAYVEDIDKSGAPVCSHPQLGAENPAVSAVNPFVYFQSVTEGGNCEYQLGGLGTLDADLAASRSPAFAMVIPNRCHDGSDTPCAPGSPAGLSDANAFLESTVTKITASKDYRDGGVIAITFDGARPGSDVTGCCGQPAFPNLTLAATVAEPTGETGPTGPSAPTGATGAVTPPPYVFKTPTGENAGGGKVGLLLISPMITGGTTYSTEQTNHFTLLASIQNWLGTTKLGFTNDVNVVPLADGIFNKR